MLAAVVSSLLVFATVSPVTPAPSVPTPLPATPPGAVTFSTSALTSPALEDPRETVVLLHGVALNRWYMARLARALRREGYHVVNLTYPSRRLPLFAIADTWLPDALARHVPAAPAATGEPGRVHFVTHSMGGLVVRRYAATHGTGRLGRVVMIAPPNHGSEAAERLRRIAPVRWMIGRNLRVLGTTAPDAAVRTLPPTLGPEVELGVLAGTHSINPITRRLLPAPHDGSVSVASTHLAGERAHATLPHSHTTILFRRATAQAVVSFLRTGCFATEPAASER